jgi:hypothetical protein
MPDISAPVINSLALPPREKAANIRAMARVEPNAILTKTVREECHV